MQSPQTNSNVALVDKCPDRDAYLFFHRVLDLCCDTSQQNDEVTAQIYLFNDENFVGKFVPAIWPTKSLFHDACHCFIQLCYKIGSEVVNPEQIVFDLSFSEKIKAIIQECIDVRRKELFKSLVFKVVTSKVAYLNSYDWNVSVVLSSDRMNVVKEPILRLNLNIHAPNENAQIPQISSEHSPESPSEILLAKSLNSSADVSNMQSLAYEFTKTELSDFIKTLEDAKLQLIQSLT